VAFGKRAAYDLAFRDARGWLYGIATHLVGQHRREEIRQFRLSRAAGPDVDQNDYSERSVVRLTAQSVRSVLVAALAELAEPDRDVLLLFAWEQLSYEEVARALGIPVGTFRSRLHRARAKIRQALADTPAAATYEELHHRAPQAARQRTVTDAHLTARQVLDRAAAAASRQPAVVPRPDQFVFTEVNVGTGVVVRTWLSVDGERNGLETQTGSGGKTSSTVILGCVNGFHKIRTPGVDGKPIKGGGKPIPMKSTTPMDGPVITEPCTPVPAYFPDMPTSASAMPGYLNQSQGISPSNLNDLAKTLGSMLQSDYFLPAQRAALYEFRAATPGLVVEHNVRDITGRPGVGVGWSFEGSRAMNIFDPASYAYLGMTTWGEQDQQGGDALLQVAVVNNSGQLP